MIIVYAQGMAVLAAASDKYEYHLDLEAVARIWRGGCIIRAALLEDIRMAYRINAALPNLLLDPSLSKKGDGSPGGFASCDLRRNQAGFALYPCFMTALGLLLTATEVPGSRPTWYRLSAITSARTATSAIDVKGTFHTDWRHGSE